MGTVNECTLRSTLLNVVLLLALVHLLLRLGVGVVEDGKEDVHKHLVLKSLGCACSHPVHTAPKVRLPDHVAGVLRPAASLAVRLKQNTLLLATPPKLCA